MQRDRRRCPCCPGCARLCHQQTGHYTGASSRFMCRGEGAFKGSMAGLGNVTLLPADPYIRQHDGILAQNRVRRKGHHPKGCQAPRRHTPPPAAFRPPAPYACRRAPAAARCRARQNAIAKRDPNVDPMPHTTPTMKMTIK